MHELANGKTGQGDRGRLWRRVLGLFLLPALLLSGGLVAAVLAAPQRQEPVVDSRVWEAFRQSAGDKTAFVINLQTPPGRGPESVTDAVIDAQMGFEELLAAMVESGEVDDYTAYYGANTIIVTGSQKAVLYLAGQPEVAVIAPYVPGERWQTVYRQITTLATGQITGNVTNANGTIPLANIDITAYYQVDPISWVVAGTATTNASGDYTVGGLASGLYRVRFRDPGGTYVTEYYNDRFSFSLATNITVVDGQTTPGINATMGIAGNVTGRVTRQSGGNAPDITVTALRSVDLGWQIFGSDNTDSAGRFNIGGLISGTYRIQFSDITDQFVTEYYNNKPDLASADNVIINSGATTANIDAVLSPYGSLSGNVTGSLGQYGVDSLDIYVYEYNAGGGYWDVASYAETDLSGNYKAFGLVTNYYRVEFTDPFYFFSTEYYDDQPDIDSAADISVTVSLDTPGINASLISPSTTFTQPLAADWNLVSFPLYVANTETGAAYSSIASNYEVVWAYKECETPADPWKVFNPTAPPFANDLKNVDVKYGMWVQTIVSDTLSITGPEAYKTVFNLCSGWNLIGYPSLTARAPADVLAGISGKYNIVWGYEAADTLDPWKKYNPALPVGNDLTMMKPGHGYWLLMKQSATLTIANR